MKRVVLIATLSLAFSGMQAQIGNSARVEFETQCLGVEKMAHRQYVLGGLGRKERCRGASYEECCP